MAFYSLIGRQHCSDSRKTRCKSFTASFFSTYIRFFVKVLIETNVNISNELNFSNVYRRVNYLVSLAKLTWGSFTLYVTQCSVHFDKQQKNEIHSLNICVTERMLAYVSRRYLDYPSLIIKHKLDLQFLSLDRVTSPCQTGYSFSTPPNAPVSREPNKLFKHSKACVCRLENLKQHIHIYINPFLPGNL